MERRSVPELGMRLNVGSRLGHYDVTALMAAGNGTGVMYKLSVRSAGALVVLTLFFAAPGCAPGQLGAAVTSEGAAIAPFTIAVPSPVLTDLNERLRRARLPEEIPGMNWNDGTDLTYLKQFVAYWRDTYDWRAQERRLNQFDQFTTRIDGIDIHFVHRRSEDPNALPLLLLNGWPSSFAEYSKVIMPLVAPPADGASVDQAFHVVIPSMPGFGFSGKRTTYGYTPDQIARMWATLMSRLGYGRYGIAASDWGAFVGERVAMFDAAHVQAIYVQDICPTGNLGTLGSRTSASRWLASMAGTNTAFPQTRLRAQRLAGRSRGLVAWLVPMVGGQRWEHRERVHEGRAPHQHHDLLGDELRRVGCPDLLRDDRGAERRAAGLLRRAPPV